MTENGDCTDGTVRTTCDECDINLYHGEGYEFGHGSYCDYCSKDYRYMEPDTDHGGGDSE